MQTLLAQPQNTNIFFPSSEEPLSTKLDKLMLYCIPMASVLVLDWTKQHTLGPSSKFLMLGG